MSETGVSPNEIRAVLDENPNISVIRGEYGELHITKLNSSISGGVELLMRAELSPDQEGNPTGMKITVVPQSARHPSSIIKILPEEGVYKWKLIDSHEPGLDVRGILAAVRGGIKIFKAYKASGKSKHLFSITDPDSPTDTRAADLLREDADYLDFNSNEDPNPEEVVERLASRKVARRIGLSSMDEDPLPSEHVILMEKMLNNLNN